MNTVLVALHRKSASGKAAGDAVPAGACFAERVGTLPAYRCASVCITNLVELAIQESSGRPQVLIIDVSLLAAASDAAICSIHQRMPETAWVLAWEMPAPGDFKAVLRSQARGCIAWDSSTEHMERALCAVLAGDVWFSRRFMQSLYFSLLAGSHTDATAPVTGEELQSRGTTASGQRLTPRELQTLELMREGLTNKHISACLGISVSTVKKHLEHAFDKQGLHSRRQLRG